ncbi:PAS domain-containing protein [Alkalibacillus silvisoli]|uniref:PAS domain S-box protein n=1 Tax=Alkalibacillus silvisoli TaxID=392823 RepID=A0ABN1A3H6_9BACI
MKEQLLKWTEKLKPTNIQLNKASYEKYRLKMVQKLNLDFHKREKRFDDITELAKDMFDVEIALISIIEEDWQWFKSSTGLPKHLEKEGAPRDLTFCQYLITEDRRLMVEDASQDSKFQDHPFVKDGTISFYAGVPLRLSNGLIIGSLCILDSKPNKITKKQFNQLEKLANWAISEIEIKQKVQSLSEQQHSINSLVERNAYLTAGIEHSSSSIIITDAKEAHNPIIYANQAFSELTGYSKNEVIGKSFNFLQGTDTDKDTIDLIHSSINTHNPLQTEVLNYKKNGDPFWNELFINPVADDDGEINYFIAIQHDITKQKKIEQGLVQELFEKNSLFNSLPELIIMLDENGNIRNANNRLEQYSSYKLPEVTNHSLRDYVLIKDFNEKLHHIYEEGELTFEATLVTKKKEHLPFQWNLLALEGANKERSGIVAIGEDIRDRLQLQKDVEYAGKLQKELLQPNLKTDKLTLRALHKPSQYVSGDSYGYDYDEQSNRLFIYLVDVMGHGVATALQTSTINLLFHQVSREDMPVKEKVEWVNKACIPIFPSSYFATAFCCDIDLTTGEVHYVAAGINFFAYEQDGQTTGAKVHGPIIGLQSDMEFKEHKLKLSSGDALYLMTDGLYDELNLERLPNNFEQFYSLLSTISETQLRKDDATAICLQLQ